MASNYVLPVFNNLVCFDVTKKELDPKNIVGDLAERWEMSPDGLTYTFYLHEGVKWHDGKDFTADDIVGNFEKIMDPERSSLAPNFPSFDRAEAVDTHTVKVYLTAPQPSFLAQLCSGYCPIVPLHTGADWKTTDFMVGTGPFKFKSSTAGVAYEYERNPDYFKKDEDGNQLPYLDGLKINIIPDRSAQADAVVAKRVDMTRPGYGVTNIETFNRYQEQTPDLQYDWWLGGAQIFAMNQDHAPLDDIRVRRALILAVDWEAVLMGAWGDTRFRDQNYSAMPGVFALDKAERDKLLGYDKPYDERVAEAQQLMAEAGYSDGFPLKIVSGNQAELTRLSEAISDLYRRHLNLEMEIVAVPYAQIFAISRSGDYDLLNTGLNTMAGDPDEVVTNFVTGAPDNLCHYSNPEVDRLSKEQSAATDLAKRIEMCKEIERIILRDAVIIPQGQSVYSPAFWPYVKGFVQQNVPYGSYLRFERAWLDK